MPTRLRYELVLVVLVCAAVLVPGLWTYTLVDPWETHYGEVARMMLENHDWVHTEWPQNDEGFRSKPVLTFWLMAAGLRAVGVGADGGYSGEMVASLRTMLGIRLPFAMCAIAGLASVWVMLARLVSRRLAWLALLVLGTTPFLALVARQALPDTPLLACTLGAIALFILATEDGERPATRRARVALYTLAGGFVVAQALYYVGHATTPLLLPLAMLVALVAQARDGLTLLRMPLLALGGVSVELRALPRRERRPGESSWRYGMDVIVASWDRSAPDRYLVRVLVYPFAWANGDGWAQTHAYADRVLSLAPLTTMRQLYLLGAYALVGVAILAKGPPGVAIVGGVALLHTLATNRWADLVDRFELKRGGVLLVAIALPWHVAMYYADGPRFVDEYWGIHILARGTSGTDSSVGTFAYYTGQLGHGMFLWAALLPSALAHVVATTSRTTRAGRVRFAIVLWAISSVAFFALVTTKFHHYILPAVAPLALVVAIFLDDLVAHRARLHPAAALLGVAITLLVTRDLMWEPERWIEMFVFMYTRAWPAVDPYAVDPSDAFLALGLAGSTAILALAIHRRAGVVLVGGVALAIALWSLHGYMPIAARHWGMRDAIATYYRERTIYGARVTYFSATQLADAWRAHPPTYRFESVTPEALVVGQPMTLHLVIEHESEFTLHATVAAIDGPRITMQFLPNETHRLDGAIARGTQDRRYDPRRPYRSVVADRLLAWQLYWRGENFWSGDEIWGWEADMKTAFMKVDNLEIGHYLLDRKRAPLGRRYFVITEPSRIGNFKGLLPTERARDSFEIIDATSNKFTLVSFWL